MNLRDEIVAMGLTEGQAVIHLADEIDGLRSEMRDQHKQVGDRIDNVAKNLGEFKAETRAALDEARNRSTQILFMIAGVFVTAGVNIALAVIR